MSYFNVLRKAFIEGINSVLPESVIKESLDIKDGNLGIKGDIFPLKPFYLFGSGKASINMAKAVEDVLGDYILGGTVVCNYFEQLKKVKVIKGSHPVPDENSIKAGETILREISSLKEEDFFIYLLSGGSSSLLEKPIPPITLDELKTTTQLLLKSGASIDEINTVRKHISMVKGGKLAQATKARGAVLVISDVIDDDLKVIGSAPFYCDKSTYKDAYNILEKYNLIDKIPKSVLFIIKRGLEGEIEETLKKPPDRIKHYIIANNIKALSGVERYMNRNGINSFIISSKIQGEAKEVAKVFAGIGKDIKKTYSYFKPPVALIFGGETTVTVKGNGKGGRNQELALSFLNSIKDICGIYFLSAGTDGIDGVTDVAGAVVNCELYKKAVETDIYIQRYLDNNDSYNFFKKVGGHIKTGYTGTNVMDIMILFVEG